MNEIMKLMTLLGTLLVGGSLLANIVNMFFCLIEQESIAGEIINALMLDSKNIYGDILLVVAYIITLPFAISTIILGIIIGIVKIGFTTPSEAFELLKVAIGLEEYLDTKKNCIRVGRKKGNCRYIY